jgi:hypothetical protein
MHQETLEMSVVFLDFHEEQFSMNELVDACIHASRKFHFNNIYLTLIKDKIATCRGLQWKRMRVLDLGTDVLA